MNYELNKKIFPIPDSRFSRGGFTIIELLVSMSVFLIVTSIVVANFRQGSQRDDLQQSALLISSLLQQAQAYALAGRTTASSVPAGGYGLYLDLANKNQAVFFPDFNSNGLYDSASETVTGWQYTLSGKVELSSLSVANPTPQATSPVAFTFRPPQGARYINNVINAGLLEVIVEHVQSLQQYKITANAVSGQVNVSQISS
ncbi:MAG: prepilin-type N-terminal cleavage/methylation domain-containing protein [Candidatus Kerfeldbacteria bacterium]|nr:prepilin-type N-terminal cleavage/methylation domain-containing protein [Candidatus Kerfeldbacteria bacterium]